MHYLRTEAWHQARMQALARKQRGFIINPYTYATGGGGDPYFANVVSLLHMDGADLSTTFTDQIPARSWSNPSNTAISTAQYVFGGASGSFNSAASNQITDADHADWNFGSGDFTLEGRARFTTLGTDRALISKANAGGLSPFLVYILASSGNLRYYSSSNGTSFDIAAGVNMGTVTTDVWYSWAVSRVGTNIYCFMDGVLGSTTSSSAAQMNTSDVARIGSWSTLFLHGYQDEVRVTKGVGRYTGNYTPDATAFPDS